MDYILQRIAYLEGLVDGLAIDESSKEGQVLLELIDIVGDLADTVNEELLDLESYVDVVEEDLSDLEDEVYGGQSLDLDFLDDFDDYDVYDDFDDEDYDDLDEEDSPGELD
ncbi:MAG: hypothetical protein Q4E37_01295 [Tissierellia bacterium]|nr:hypothetical protein [Tissierellia bacterium]